MAKKQNVQPAWVDGDNAGVAAQRGDGQASAAPTPVTPTPTEVLPAALVVPANAGNPHNPRSLDYAIHALQQAAKPATLPAADRAALVAKRDELAEQLLAAESEMANLDSDLLPEDVLAAINMQQERDARRIELGSATTIIAARLRPFADALARDNAARDAIAANDAQLAKLIAAKDMIADVWNAAGAFYKAADALVAATSQGVPRGSLAGVGAIPAVHFTLQDAVELVGNALVRIGNVR